VGSTATALVRVEDTPVAAALNDQSQALLELLPDAAAVTRFKRVVLQAMAKNPDLLACTPDSVVTSVFEAAAMGLEPTGAAGGAHLVPFNVNVGTADNPRWEKRAQLIPDFRGVVAMVTRPAKDGTPSEVVSVEARTVKEGDEFRYTLGIDAELVHVPTLAPNRSAKPTTHVYAIFRLRSGGAITDVMDHAEVERVRGRGKKKKGINPWDTDWDEMGKKTVLKRGAKLVPVRPEVRSILAREDESEEPPTPVSVPMLPAAPRTAQLAARLRPAAPAPVPADEAEYVDVPEGADEDPGRPGASEAGTATLTQAAFRAGITAAGLATDQVVAAKDALFPTEDRLDDAMRGAVLARAIADAALAAKGI
jgi:recombination protein RecT